MEPAIAMVIGIGLTVMAAGLMVWALALGKAAQRRCPGCWYDMGATEGRLCPECGRTARSEAALHRKPGRWGWVLVTAAAGVAAWQAFEQPRRQGQGWFGWVPTTALIFCVEAEDYLLETPLGRSIRARGGDMWWWQRALVDRRDRRFDVGELGRVVKTRAKWPIGSRAVFAIDPPATFWPNVERRTLTVTDETGRMMSAGMSPPGVTSCFGGGGPPREVSFPCDRMGKSVRRFAARLLGTGTDVRWEFDVEIEVVADPHEVIEPVDAPEMSEVVRRGWVANAREVKWYDGELYLAFVPVPYATVPGGVRAELLMGGRVIAEFGMPEQSNHLSVPLPWRESGDGSLRDAVLAWPLRAADLARMHVRIMGDPVVSVENIYDTSYWAGTMEWPLRELMQRVDPETGLRMVGPPDPTESKATRE